MKWKHIIALGTALCTAGTLCGSAAASTGLQKMQEKLTETAAAEWIEGEAVVLYSGLAHVQGESSGSETVVRSFDLTMPTETEAWETLPLLQSSATTSGHAAMPETCTISLVRSETETTEELIARLEQQPNVLCAEPNYQIQIQSVTDHINALWGLQNTGQNDGIAGCDVNAEVLQGTLSDTEMVIAILDTGMHLTHPDLEPYLWTCPNTEVSEFMGEHGYDYVNYDDDPTDDHGHGTHCAGIIASVLEQAGANSVKLLPMKILNVEGVSGIYSELEAYYDLYQLRQYGVNVVAANNSWGCSLLAAGESGDIMNMMMTLAGESGVLSICAAGNDSYSVDDIPDYPSSLDNPYVIAVAASDESDNLADFSNYGKEKVDLAAPGVNILSTYAYPVFEPNAFSEEQRSQLVDFYDGFSDEPPVQTETDNLSAFVDGNTVSFAFEETGAEQFVTLTEDRFFGAPTEQNGSLVWEYVVPEDMQCGKLYLPIPLTVSEIGMRDCSLRFAVETEGTDGWVLISENTISEDGAYGSDETKHLIADNYYFLDSMNGWETLTFYTFSRDVATANALELSLLGNTAGGVIRIYLDECYVGIETDMSDSTLSIEQKYPYYTYMNGTSMATPYVTAAAGLMALRNPSGKALDWAMDLLEATRPVDALSGLVKTGGVLDFSQLGVEKPLVLDAELDKANGLLTLTGRNLDLVDSWHDASVAIPAEAVQWTETELILDVSALGRKFMDVSLLDAAGNLIYQHTGYYPTGMEPEDIAVWQNGAEVLTNHLFTLEDSIYAMDENGNIMQLLPESGWEYCNTSGFPMLFDAEPMGSYGIAAGDNACYAIVNYYLVDPDTLEILVDQDILLRYDFHTGEWSNCGSVKAHTGMANSMGCDIQMTYGNGLVWLVCNDWNAGITEVYTYDADNFLESDAWNNVTTAPVCYNLSAVCWVNGKLLLTHDQMPTDNLFTPQWIYDPETDTWSETDLLAEGDVQKTYYDTDCVLYPAAITADDRYVVYSGLAAQDMGDLILYDTVENQFLSTGYTLYEPSQQYLYQSIVCGGILYFFYVVPVEGEPSYAGQINIQVKAVSMEALAASAEEPMLEQKMGDVDGDGQVMVEDAVAVLTEYAQRSAGLGSALTAEQERCSDIDEDGSITVEDACGILTYYAMQSAGLIPHF